MKENNLELNLTLNDAQSAINYSLNYSHLRKSLLIVRAINHPVRLNIIESILENGSMTVTEIYSKLKIEQSVISQHLVILKSAKVVKFSRNGKFMNYTINEERLTEIENFIKSYSN